jgi:hypothetical protein
VENLYELPLAPVSHAIIRSQGLAAAGTRLSIAGGLSTIRTAGMGKRHHAV